MAERQNIECSILCHSLSRRLDAGRSCGHPRAMRAIDPWFGLSSTLEAAKTVVIVGCPFESGDAFRPGADKGPAAIREWACTAEAINEVGDPINDVRVIDFGDAGPSEGTGEERWQVIENAATQALKENPGAFLLGIGGDHAVTPPLATAARKGLGEMAFILLDAHPDCFESYDGDPLSHACVVPRVWDRAGFDRATTCIAGVRSYSFEELRCMNAAGLVIPAQRWQVLGNEELAAEIHDLTAGMPLYISLDIDLLDPAHAPGTGYPVAGGPDVREVLTLLAQIWRQQPVAAFDIVEVAPSIDPTGITAANATHILLQALGQVSAAL